AHSQGQEQRIKGQIFKSPQQEVLQQQDQEGQEAPRVVLVTREEYSSDEVESSSDDEGESSKEVAAIVTTNVPSSSLFESPNENPHIKNAHCFMAKSSLDTSIVLSTQEEYSSGDDDVDDEEDATSNGLVALASLSTNSSSPSESPNEIIHVEKESSLMAKSSKDELAKASSPQSKLSLDDLLSKQRSNNGKEGLGYNAKAKKANKQKAKPAQEKKKAITNGEAPKGNTINNDDAGNANPNYDYAAGGSKWVLDSGCTSHMTGGKNLVKELRPNINNITISFGDNSTSEVMGFGKVVVAQHNICGCHACQTLGYNLLSVSALGKMGFAVFIDNDIVVLLWSKTLKVALLGIANITCMWWTFRGPPLQVRCAYSERRMWLWHRRLAHTKDETQQIFIDFATEVQRQHNLLIMAIRSDNGSEFKNYTLNDFLSDEGIRHQYSAAYTPQQNGVVERKNRTLMDMARSMMAEYKSRYNFGAEAISTACHSSNRLYLRKGLNKTPYEILTGNKPNISYFKVFGCLRGGHDGHAVNTGKGAWEQGDERATSTRAAKPPLERDGHRRASSHHRNTFQAAMHTLATPIVTSPAKVREEWRPRARPMHGGAHIIRRKESQPT
ncbi:hypothetical protein QYE76_036001, partial [Lolium multiflorum]